MKQPLSSLSSIMPAKGEAARVEAMPDKVTPKRAEKAPRSAMTSRVLIDHIERMHVMAFQEGISKQELLDQAIAEYLARKGY